MPPVPPAREAPREQVEKEAFPPPPNFQPQPAVDPSLVRRRPRRRGGIVATLLDPHAAEAMRDLRRQGDVFAAGRTGPVLSAGDSKD